MHPSLWFVLPLLLSASAEYRLPLDIHGVHQTAENDFWISGKRGSVCRVSLPPGGFDPAINCVSLGDVLITSIAFRESWGVAAGEGGALFVTNDTGASWKKAETSIPYHLLDVEIVNDSVAVAVGDWGTVVRTEDGGKTWRETPLEFEHTTDYLGVPVLSRSYVLRDPESDEGAPLIYFRGHVLTSQIEDVIRQEYQHIFVRNDLILNDIIVDGKDLYLAAERGKLFLSTDRGLHFREISLRPDSTDDPFAGEEDQATWFFGALESTDGTTATLLLGGSLATLKTISLGKNGVVLKQEILAAPWENQPAIFSGATNGQTVCLAGAEGTIGTSFDGGKTFAKVIDRAYEARWFRRALAPSEGRCIFFGEKGLIVEVTR